MKNLFIIPISIIVASCTLSDPAQRLVEDAVRYHGFDQLNDQPVYFTFRDAQYSIDRNSASGQVYTKTFKALDTVSGQMVEINDTLVNSTSFRRYVSGQQLELSAEDSDRFAQSLNSVAYFFQLPLPLLDEAAQLEQLPDTQIKGKNYRTLAVSFTPDQGGNDHEDTFRYYFDPKTKALTYLSYAYETNGGGIRFRAAQPFEQGPYVFLNYLNYKPKSLVSLDSLPALYNTDQLELLSEIIHVVE
jgi:hypothetical protein